MGNTPSRERLIYLNKIIDSSNLTIDIDTGKIVGYRGGTGYYNNRGYLVYSLYYKELKKDIVIPQHQIIAIKGFGINVCSDKVIDHIDNKHNTQYDNRVNNLQLVTNSDNVSKSWKDTPREMRDYSYKQISVLIINVKNNTSEVCLGINYTAKRYNINSVTLSTNLKKHNKYKVNDFIFTYYK